MLYCNYSGGTHKKKEPYPTRSPKTMSIRSSTVAAKLAAQADSHEDVGELDSSFSAISLEEHERCAHEAMEEVETEICIVEQEDHLERLKGEREKLQRGTPTGGRTAGIEKTGTTSLATGAFRTNEDEQGLTLPAPSCREHKQYKEGYSDYGRSFWHSREPRRHPSRSRSDSSETRRRHSKWVLKHHMVGGKDVRKLNAYKLIAASLL